MATLLLIVLNNAAWNIGIDAVAPVLTNFFLVTYTLTNLSAALLELSGCPNFRPTWRYYSWHLSLLGAALTLGAMFFLNPGCATTYHPHPHP